MLTQAKLPKKFWVEALNTAVYLRNRSPTKAVNHATPFEAWTGDKPDVSHLCSFGCTAYAERNSTQRSGSAYFSDMELRPRDIISMIASERESFIVVM